MYRCLTMKSPLISIERLKKLEDFGVDPCPKLSEVMPQLGSQKFLKTVDWMMSITAEARPQTVNDILDVWAGKNLSSVPAMQLTNEPKKNKKSYKILIAGPEGSGKATAVQAISELNKTGAVKQASTGRGDKAQTNSMDYASFDISNNERILLYSIPEQEQYKVAWNTLQKGAIGLVLLIDNGRENPLGDLDAFLELLEGFVDKTGMVIGINRTEQYPSPDIHDYHSHLVKIQRNWKSPPPIMEVDPGNPEEMRKLLISLLFHLYPGL